MSNNNQTCLVDKKAYRYCPHCENDKNKPSWYSLFCCENCKNIFTILRDNSLGKVTDDDARKELSKLDLSHQNEFDEDIKNRICQLLQVKEVDPVTQEEKVVVKTDSNESSQINDKKKFVRKNNK